MTKGNTITCKTCKYFKQHYIRWGKGYSKLTYGHCGAFPRIKKQMADAPVCARYQRRPKREAEEY